MLKRVLLEWGIPSVTALGGSQALDIFREHSQKNVDFSATLLDIDMQGFDALQLAELICASPAATEIIVMLHSPLDSVRANECKRLGILTLLKPLRRLPLWEILRREKSIPLSTSIAAASSTATDKAAGASGLRILLAEDNIVNQRLISRILEKMGHTVVVANDGADIVATSIRSGSHGYADASHGWGRGDAKNSVDRIRHNASYANHCDYC